MEPELEATVEDVKLEITKLTVVRFVARTTVKCSVSFVVGSALKTVCPTENKTEQVKLFIGGYVLGAMICEKTGEWIDTEITDAVDSYRKLKLKKTATVIKTEPVEVPVQEEPPTE